MDKKEKLGNCSAQNSDNFGIACRYNFGTAKLKIKFAITSVHLKTVLNIFPLIKNPRNSKKGEFCWGVL